MTRAQPPDLGALPWVHPVHLFPGDYTAKWYPIHTASWVQGWGACLFLELARSFHVDFPMLLLVNAISCFVLSDLARIFFLIPQPDFFLTLASHISLMHQSEDLWSQGCFWAAPATTLTKFPKQWSSASPQPCLGIILISVLRNSQCFLAIYYAIQKGRASRQGYVGSLSPWHNLVWPALNQRC